MKYRLFITVLLITAQFTNCHRDKSPVSPTPESFLYPLKIGNTWTFQRAFYNVYASNDSLAANPADTLFATHVIKIAKEVTLQDSIKTVQFLETRIEEGRSATTETYYANRSDGFYMVGYNGGGTAIPKSAAGHKLLFKGFAFASISDLTDFFVQALPAVTIATDSLIIENPPVRSLAYPLRVGAEWTFRSDHHPWRMDKKVIAETAVLVPAGDLHCLQIRYFYDINHDGQWDDDIVVEDFISRQGLVKRNIAVYNMEVMNETGDVIGTFDGFEDIILTSFTL